MCVPFEVANFILKCLKVFVHNVSYHLPVFCFPIFSRLTVPAGICTCILELQIPSVRLEPGTHWHPVLSARE